ncbi:MAG: hypothetical protein HC899_34505 [Leptolyngbyaceae cyanobacterium SM1_4_3]|nr:hypothetical protein [Leptolyngbyaceae cyanobacterium SM1_4_3]
MKEISLFVSSSDVLDLTIELSQYVDIRTKVQQKSVSKPNADKEHPAYNLSEQDWVNLVVSFSDVTSNLLMFATAIINLATARKLIQVIINNQLAIPVSARTSPEELAQKLCSQVVNNIYISSVNFQAVTVTRSQFMSDNRYIDTGGGNYIESNSGTYVQGNYVTMNQDLAHAAAQIQDLIEQLQRQGVTVDVAQEQVAKDMATQAQTNSTVKDKLLKWGQSLGDATVSDVVKGAVKLAIRSAGIPLP